MLAVKLGASVDCADYANLEAEIRALERGGVDFLHFDIMDGDFVGNFALGTRIVKVLREKTSLLFDIHLAVYRPERFIDVFADAGADMISVHAEATPNLNRVLQSIRRRGLKACVAYNTGTSVSNLDYILPNVDMILCMTVDAGFPGQEFVPQVIKKIRATREACNRAGVALDLEVDGAVNEETLPLLRSAGANVFVFGSSGLFQKKCSLELQLGRLREILAAAQQD